MLEDANAQDILSDLRHESVAMAIEVGLQLDNVEGKPPDGALLKIKGVAKRIRDHYLRWATKMNKEEARINTIKECQGVLQQRMFALIVAVGVGVANFVSRLLRNRRVGDYSE